MPSAQELLEAGVHFGHRTSAWHPKMEPYIFGVKQNIHIIDLAKTLQKLEEALVFLSEVLGRGGQILLVGTKPAAKEIIKETAEKLGMPYVKERWLGGTLTNFKTIAKRIEYYHHLIEQQKSGELAKYTKKERLHLERKLAKLDRQLFGIRNLNKIPQALLVASPKADNTAVREAIRLKVPVVALVDTNTDPTTINYMIPANDDAASSLRKIFEIISDNLLEVKKTLLANPPAEEKTDDSSRAS